jgi:pSer/pThr/pTyr-binding forkhead associated (FHA) protein
MVRLFNKPQSQLLSSSAWGFVALGACIGLFIGLAQVILKEAWVKVETGPRSGRELILTKDETTIGRAEACDIGLFGDNTIEKMHARIVLKNGRYLLVDADTPSGTYLNDERITEPAPLRSGDLIRVGRDRLLRFSEKQKRR